MDKRKEDERDLAEWADKMAEIHGSADVDEILYEAERKERRDELKVEIQGTPVVGVFSAATAMQRARGLRFRHEREKIKLWGDLLFPVIKFIGGAVLLFVFVSLVSLWPLALSWGITTIKRALF